MARIVKTEQEKKKNFIKVLIATIVIILVVCVAAFVIIKVFKEEPKAAVRVNILQKDDTYGYTLTDNDTAYYKSEFDKLIKIINAKPVDEEAYATQVARMFTIDLYTMSSKVNKYDIGGYEFFYEDKRDNFEKKVIYELYSSLLDNTYGDRKQVLPEITDVTTVSTEKTTYQLGDQTVDGYLVKLKMTYKEDLGYDEEASIVVCKETKGNKWSVVDFQPTLDPKYTTKNNS